MKLKGLPSHVLEVLIAWKVSKYEVISGPYFPVFGLNTQIYSVFNSTTEKYGPEITPHLDTFHAVSKQAVTAPNLLVLIWT